MGTTAYSESPARIAQNAALRLKNNESKFEGDLEKCWQEYLEGTINNPKIKT